MHKNVLNFRVLYNFKIILVSMLSLLAIVLISVAVFTIDNNNAYADRLTSDFSNQKTITGFVQNENSDPVDNAKVSAYKGEIRLGTTNTISGEFILTLDQDINDNEHVMLIVTHKDYPFEIIDATVDANPINITLKFGTMVNIKAANGEEKKHATFTIKTEINNESSKETIGEPLFSNQFPIGGTITMTSTAHLLYNYVNSNNQNVNIEILANGSEGYKSFFWGAQFNDSQFLLQVEHPYTIDEFNKCIVAVFYQGLANLCFMSNSDGHNYFDVNYIKNGAPYVKLQQTEFRNTTFEGADCTVLENGNITIYFDSSDEVNTYKVAGTITPVPKDGYKFTNWIYNGTILKPGDNIKAEFLASMNFEANYDFDNSLSAQTSDSLYIFIMIVSFIALISLGYIIYNRKIN